MIDKKIEKNNEEKGKQKDEVRFSSSTDCYK